MHQGTLIAGCWAIAASAAADAPSNSAPDAAAPPTAAATPAEWFGGAPWWRWTRATGDWGGVREQLAERGFEFGGSYTADWTAAWRGGLRHRDSVCSLLDVNVSLDLEPFLGVPRTLVYLDAQSVQGREPSADVGDLQGVGNVQGVDTDQLAEAWVETWLGEHVRVKAGKVDFNSEFAFTEVGGEFIHPSAAISPTIVGAPTNPNPATSLNLFVQPCETCYCGLGLYDGAFAVDGVRTGRHGLLGPFEDDDSDDWFAVVEGGVAWRGSGVFGTGRAALGAWRHTGDFTTHAGGSDSCTEGVYLVVDQNLAPEHPDDPDDAQGIGLFGSFGVADDEVSAVHWNAVLGVAWTGALRGRDHDVLGLAVLHADLADSLFARDETTFELFYRLQLTPSVSLKPDLQLVVDPSGDPAIGDALVGTLRLEINF
jgi:porin